jgi:hypothetical protein
MTELSPKAQSVLDAFLVNWQDEPLEQDLKCLADALRAAVYGIDYITSEELLTIANELDGV